jgi:hypothetical protein
VLGTSEHSRITDRDRGDYRDDSVAHRRGPRAATSGALEMVSESGSCREHVAELVQVPVQTVGLPQPEKQLSIFRMIRSAH